MISPKLSTAPKLTSIDLAALAVTRGNAGSAGRSFSELAAAPAFLPSPNLIPQEEERQVASSVQGQSGASDRQVVSSLACVLKSCLMPQFPPL